MTTGAVYPLNVASLGVNEAIVVPGVGLNAGSLLRRIVEETLMSAPPGPVLYAVKTVLANASPYTQFWPK